MLECDIIFKRRKTDPGYDSDLEKFKLMVMTYMFIDIHLYYAICCVIYFGPQGLWAVFVFI